MTTVAFLCIFSFNDDVVVDYRGEKLNAIPLRYVQTGLYLIVSCITQQNNVCLSM